MTAEAPVFAVLAIALAILIILLIRPAITRERGGKMLAFVGIFFLPALGLWFTTSTQIERSKERTFCLSCHVMEKYGKSLLVDDEEYIPAVHYQNNWVPRDKACFTCHTDYTLYGDYKAKLRGLRHVSVQYFGTIPDTIHLYQPYNNRECLHCHGESRKFLGNDAHTEEDTTMASMRANRLSCLTSGCHDTAHDVASLSQATFWKGQSR